MNATRLLLITLLAAVAAGSVGCVKYTHPVVAEPTPQTPAERNYQAMWLAAQDVLRDYRFTLDVRDRRAGLITTEPLTGEQFFEPWRKDAVNRRALADSSLKTLRRTAVVRIQPTSPGSDQFEPIVEVTVSKPSTTPMEMHSTGAAYGMFALPGGDSDETQVGRILDYTYEDPDKPQESDIEMPVDSDPELAQRIAQDIKAAAAERLVMGQ